MAQMLADLEACILACSEWRSWLVPDKALAWRVTTVRGGHVKLPERKFSAGDRDQEMKLLREQFDAPITGAQRWTERVLISVMRFGDDMGRSRLM